MAFVRFSPIASGRALRRTGAALAVLGGVLVVTVVAVDGPAGPRRTADRQSTAERPPPATAAPGDVAPATPPHAEPTLPAAPPPADLPVLDYRPAPRGFPGDPAAMSTVRLGEGLRPVRRLAVYDAAGGRPRAFLAPTISGVPVTLPIVARRAGWAAVLLPSANRSVGWVPPGPWSTVALRDLLVVVRQAHRLHWYRDDRLVRSWPVSVGSPATPTPLGRTFVLGRSLLPGRVYAGVEVLALGAVPDDPGSVPSALRGAHIGLHAWYDSRQLGRSNSNGCIRIGRKAQELLLAELLPGTELLVLDRFSAPQQLTDTGPPPQAVRR
ncbi:L,D-transpeptidase [Micromonospora sp. WMMD1102]|uniref:L,D-transpeptidase n=1 Tax=Micromonospora sp. WMMD1102 TaxID=3016105 RepID=UPI0024155449|nr:L,D-transpeptidase [Micromonospora sp. WMMD1102]MDG4789069.1 L,D-transpeptidase [Micromonospora sp. WMMD1102]